MENHLSEVNRKSDKKKKMEFGHTLCKETRAKEKTALDWNPERYRR